MKHYIPTAGTMADRVIAWLEENHPDGEKVPGQVICEALEIRPTAFAHNLLPSMRAGLLHGEKLERNSRLQWFFWLGDKPARPPHESIAERVLNHLKSLPDGTRVKTPDLAKAIDAEPAHLQELRKRLQLMVAPKLRTQTMLGHGNVAWWSLPEFDAIEQDDEEDIPPRRYAPEIQPRPGPWFPGLNVSALRAAA